MKNFYGLELLKIIFRPKKRVINESDNYHFFLKPSLTWVDTFTHHTQF